VNRSSASWGIVAARRQGRAHRQRDITAVSVTGDLRTARVYYLVFGKDGPDPKVAAGSRERRGFLRNALSRS